MSKAVIFVIGATGKVGTATVTSLSAKYADKIDIRAGVHNLEKAEKLKAVPNVTVVHATIGVSNLVGILTGVSTLYIVTPGMENRVELVIKTAEYAKQACVKHIVLVSLPIAELPETVFGCQLSEVEDKVSKLGVPYTFIRPNFFMENYHLYFKTPIMEQATIYFPVDPRPDTQFMPIAVEDIGKTSAVILANPESMPTAYGDCHMHGDFAKALSKALGREIKYIRVPYESAKKSLIDSGAQEWQADGILEGLQLIDSRSPLVTGNDLGVYKCLTGESPTDLKKWVDRNAGGFQ